MIHLERNGMQGRPAEPVPTRTEPVIVQRGLGASEVSTFPTPRIQHLSCSHSQATQTRYVAVIAMVGPREL